MYITYSFKKNSRQQIQQQNNKKQRDKEDVQETKKGPDGMYSMDHIRT